MRRIQASEAKTHLPRLLDDIERGETILITRHGRPIARLIPEADRRQAEINDAIDRIERQQASNARVTTEELLAWKHEGHEY